MARNLVAAGHEVRAWNRSGGATEGVTMVSSPAEVFTAEAVMTMLSDDDAIRSVILEQNLLAHAAARLVHVVASTVSVAFAEELVTAHAEGRGGLCFCAGPRSAGRGR